MAKPLTVSGNFSHWLKSELKDLNGLHPASKPKETCAYVISIPSEEAEEVVGLKRVDVLEDETLDTSLGGSSRAHAAVKPNASTSTILLAFVFLKL